MALAAIHNRKGFFSDYWLGTLAGARGAAGPRLTPSQARKALARLRRAAESVDRLGSPDLGDFRERLARPLFEDVLGFALRENSEDPRLRPLATTNGDGAIAALAWLLPEAEELDMPRARRRLEDALLAENLDYGFIVSPDVLRLIRNPRSGNRGATLDLSIAVLVEEEDVESLSAAYRVLAAENFLPGADGERAIDRLESESRRHSARVSEDLKQAVFEAAELVVGGFLRDVRSRAEQLAPPPALGELRDAGFLALYRLLFILYAEARDERLIAHRLYQKSYSLDSILTRLLAAPLDRLPANGYGLWAHLLALFRVFNEGIEPHLPELENIPPRGGRLFSDETPEGALLRKLRLDDHTAAAVFAALATTHPRRGVGRERISFRELDIEQLGNVYQGLLEYEPEEAGETVILCRVAGRELALAPRAIVDFATLKALNIRGDVALVAGTEAEQLHPDAVENQATDDDDTEDDDADDDLDDAGNESEEGEKDVKRGATLNLVRRLEVGEFYFKPGGARKSSGSYYTPTPMVNYLVRDALGPLTANRSAGEIERLRVIDLACGSAHFLVGAARFLGDQLFNAYARQLDGDPPPAFYPDLRLDASVRARWEHDGRDWCKRRIVERCLYGVDLNPAAVQLAQVALWIESLAGDRPLSFFAHHIRNGNSLLGSWLDRYDEPPDPQLASRGRGQTRGLFEAELRSRLEGALTERRLIDAPLPPEVRGDTPEEYAYKADRLRRAEEATQGARLLLDLRSACPLLPAIWQELPTLMSAVSLEAEGASRPWWPAFQQIRERERFFHWELEFPEVFLETKRPGFDVVLGNPPWDKVLPTKREFFSRYDVLVSALKGQDLDRRIREITERSPELDEEFAAYRERARTIARLLRNGGDFPLAEARSQAAHEDVSKYFVDRALRIIADGGTAGLVVPSVFYNGDGWVGVRRYLLEQASIVRFYGFENRQKIFPIDSRYKFVNLVVRKERNSAGSFTAAFMRHELAELESDAPKPWEVRNTRDEIADLSPDSLALLEYRGPRDQEIVRRMYAGRPTLGGSGQGSWGARLFTDLAHELINNSARDKDLFTDPKSGRLWSPELVLGAGDGSPGDTMERMRAKGFWPVFEGKHIEQFLVGVKPIRWWLSVEQAERKYGRKPREEPTLVFRETASNTNERTCIAAVLPAQSAASHKLTGVRLKHVDPLAALTVLNSFCFDYALRMRTAGTNVSFTYIQPMPVPPAAEVASLPAVPSRPAWEVGIERVADDASLWPALWAANKAVAAAYRLSAADVAYILDTFPVFARKRPEFYAYLKARSEDREKE